MTVEFQERNDVLVATLSGDYAGAQQEYKQDSATVYQRLGEHPQRIVIDLQKVTGIDRRGLTGLEKLCWKVAKDLMQEIRLSNPSPEVKTVLDYVDFSIPVYETVDTAIESFEDDDFLEEDMKDLLSDETTGS